MGKAQLVRRSPLNASTQRNVPHNLIKLACTRKFSTCTPSTCTFNTADDRRCPTCAQPIRRPAGVCSAACLTLHYTLVRLESHLQVCNCTTISLACAHKMPLPQGCCHKAFLSNSCTTPAPYASLLLQAAARPPPLQLPQHASNLNCPAQRQLQAKMQLNMPRYSCCTHAKMQSQSQGDGTLSFKTSRHTLPKAPQEQLTAWLPCSAVLHCPS